MVKTKIEHLASQNAKEFAKIHISRVLEVIFFMLTITQYNVQDTLNVDGLCVVLF